MTSTTPPIKPYCPSCKQLWLHALKAWEGNQAYIISSWTEFGWGACIVFGVSIPFIEIVSESSYGKLVGLGFILNSAIFRTIGVWYVIDKLKLIGAIISLFSFGIMAFASLKAFGHMNWGAVINYGLFCVQIYLLDVCITEVIIMKTYSTKRRKLDGAE